MELELIFATGIGKKHLPELAIKARDLFLNKNLFDTSIGGFKTSLMRYSLTGSNAVIRECYSPQEQLIIDELKKVILVEAEDYLKTCGYTYNSEYETPVISNLWLNIMESGEHHRAHEHYGNLLSGCFYVDVPENSGGITFYGPLNRVDRPPVEVETYTIFNSHTWTIVPQAGDMLIWESYIKHEVPTTDFYGKRLSIAFDVSLNVKD